MAAIAPDLRLPSLSSTRGRGFTVVAIGTLPLGIGASTSLFSVVNAVLLRPLSCAAPAARSACSLPTGRGAR